MSEKLQTFLTWVIAIYIIILIINPPTHYCPHCQSGVCEGQCQMAGFFQAPALPPASFIHQAGIQHVLNPGNHVNYDNTNLRWN